MKKRKYNPTYESTTFIGTVVKAENGKNRIAINHPVYYQHFVNHTCKLGDIVALIMTNRRPKRSLAQNRYMHLFFSLIAESSGHTMIEIKNWAKGKHLSKGITEVYGSKVRIVKETSKLNMSEMCEFLNIVSEDTTVPLPDPEPFNLPLTIDEYGRLKEKQRIEYSKYKPKLDYDKKTTKTKKGTPNRKGANSLSKKRAKKS